METIDWEGTGRGFSRSDFAKMGQVRGIPGTGTRGPDGTREGQRKKQGFSWMSDMTVEET